MNDINWMLGYINPVILAICMVTGYVLKHSFPKFPNRFIPLLAMSMGTIIAIIISWRAGINEIVILGGMISGLASTGCYEMLRNLIDFDGKKGEE